MGKFWHCRANRPDMHVDSPEGIPLQDAALLQPLWESRPPPPDRENGAIAPQTVRVPVASPTDAAQQGLGLRCYGLVGSDFSWIVELRRSVQARAGDPDSEGESCDDAPSDDDGASYMHALRDHTCTKYRAQTQAGES